MIECTPSKLGYMTLRRLLATYCNQTRARCSPLERQIGPIKSRLKPAEIWRCIKTQCTSTGPRTRDQYCEMKSPKHKHTSSVRAAPMPGRHIVALDIGTWACGFALLKQSSTMLHTFESWPDQSTPYPKTRSALLYKSRTPIAWGWTACKQHAQLSVAEITEGSYWYVEDFKLALHDEAHAAAIRRKGLTPEQVMADYLQFFVAEVRRQLRKAHDMCSDDMNHIQWCLTVPAMWSEASKQLMRKAAVRAGLIKKQDSEELCIILEPEAAAVHAMENKAPPLIKGMTVCILDVGGGTADITVHDVKEVAGRTVLAEAVTAHGELCGSVYVDKAFREYYRAEVGVEAFDKWAAGYPDELQQLMDEWVCCKHEYQGPTPTADDKFRLMIPSRLLRLMSNERKQALAQEQGISSGSRVHELVLNSHTMRGLFDGPINKTINAAKWQLQHLKTPCSMVILVGGFASSKYLQLRVKTELTKQRLASQVVVPPRPYSAVMSGAALYGHSPSLIHARRSRLSYGIATCVPFEAGAPPESKFVHKENGKDYTDARCMRFVQKDQLIQHDEVVTYTVTPLYRSQTSSGITVYATQNKDLRWVPSARYDQNTHKLGDMDVQLSKPGHQREVTVRFKFGGTHLTVTAWDPCKGKEVAATFKFAQSQSSSG